MKKKLYRIHLITPIDGQGIFEVSYDTESKYAHDPYSLHEYGVFIRLGDYPSRLMFIPWTNITHVDTLAVE